METIDVQQYVHVPSEELVADIPVADVTEKCLNWRNSCVGVLQGSNEGEYPNTIICTQESLDNAIYNNTSTVDNIAYCSTIYDNTIYQFPENPIVDNNPNLIIPPQIIEECAPIFEQNTPASQGDHHACFKYICDNQTTTSSFASCETLSVASSSDVPAHHPKRFSKGTRSKRTRRDSEESMDTNSTYSHQSSRSYTNVHNVAYSDTVSSFIGTEFLIPEALSEADEESIVSGAQITKTPSWLDINENGEENIPESCSITYECQENPETPLLPTPEELSLLNNNITALESEIVSEPTCQIAISDPTPEPFSSHIEEIYPEFIVNPPVVTDNLIVVEDESFLHQSNLSLSNDFHDCYIPNRFMTRAFTMPDLSSAEKMIMNHEGKSPDGRLYYSDDALFQLSSSYPLSAYSSLDWEFQYGHIIDEDDDRYCQKSPDANSVEGIKVVPSSDHTVTMILLCLCNGLLQIAMVAILNLQSSFHVENGLGVLSRALVFLGYAVGCMFSSQLVRHIQPQLCLIVSIIPSIVYLMTNLSHNPLMILPLSLLQGISMATVWSVMSIYSSLLAQGRAATSGESLKAVFARFCKIISVVGHISIIVGNLIASLLLTFSNNSSELSPASESAPQISPHPSDTFVDQAPSLAGASSQTTESPYGSPSVFSIVTESEVAQGMVCGAGYAVEDFVVASLPNDTTMYMLHGTFIGCALVALGIAVFGIEPLNMALLSSGSRKHQCNDSNSAKSLSTAIKDNLQAMAFQSRDVKFLLLIPIIMYSILQSAFVSAEVTAAFITCPSGITHIGFSMALFSCAGFPLAHFCKPLARTCGRIPLITIAAAANLICLILLSQWVPSKGQFYLTYPMMLVWGATDGIWISQVNDLVATTFKRSLNGICKAMSFIRNIGAAIMLASSPFIDMRIKVYVMIGVCLLGLTGYFIASLRIATEKRWSRQQVYNIDIGAGNRTDV